MALLEELNQVINQLDSNKQPSGEGESDATPNLDDLVDLLCEEMESQKDSSSDTQSDFTSEEIHYLVNLRLEQLESFRSSLRDSSDPIDQQMDRLVDLLLDLLKYSYSSDRSQAISASKKPSNPSLSEMPPGSPGSENGGLGDTAKRSKADLRRISEFIKIVNPRSEEVPESVVPKTGADPLAEELLPGVKQPTDETVTGRSPQKPEQSNLVDPEADPKEVARSVDFLHQLMFPNQSPEETQTKAANSQDHVVAEADSPADSKLLDDVLSSQSLGNSSESHESDVPDLTLDKLIDELLDQPIDQLVEQWIDELLEQPIDQLIEQPKSEPDRFSAAEKQPTNPPSGAIEDSQQSEFINVEVLEPLETEEENDPRQSEFKLLQNLLVNPEVEPLRKLNQKLDDKLSYIDRQIHDPKELIHLLMPVMAELLNMKVEESKEDISQAIAPIIDRAIQQRSQQDKYAMSSVLATLIPEAISYQIKQEPEEIAKAIAPEIALAIREQIKLDRTAIINVLASQMGEAIKEQIKLEKEAMVDALYPVIGSTVAKYIAEAIREINQKIAKALSADGFRRKIRAKLQGVSEGELIFKDSMALTVQGIFLIHKQSGLIISQAQPPENSPLEPEMVAAMLTAIRSFVNDCIVQSGEVAELDDIEYGLSTIKLEVAGYCYMAVLLKGGSPPKQFVKKMRHTLSQIVLNYSQAIEEFDGDPESAPQEIHESIADLVAIAHPKNNRTSTPILQLFAIAAFGLIFGLIGWNFYQTSVERRLETQILTALDTSPELAIYRLNVEVEKNSITLKGKLPNNQLRTQAEEIVKDKFPSLKLNSQVMAVEIPPDPVFVENEVNRIAQTLNQMAGISITVKYEAGKVIVDGIVVQQRDSQTISQAFETIPGVNSVVSAVQVQPLTIETRIYFDQNSSKIKPEDVKTNLLEIKRFLTQYPQVHLNIVGHSDRTGKTTTNQRLALQRAETVQKALISLGLAPERLHISANPEPPIDLEQSQPKWKHRCVIFYPIIPPNQP